MVEQRIQHLRNLASKIGCEFIPPCRFVPLSIREKTEHSDLRGFIATHAMAASISKCAFADPVVVAKLGVAYADALLAALKA